MADTCSGTWLTHFRCVEVDGFDGYGSEAEGVLAVCIERAQGETFAAEGLGDAPDTPLEGDVSARLTDAPHDLTLGISGSAGRAGMVRELGV